jgi:hypothetical protein
MPMPMFPRSVRRGFWQGDRKKLPRPLGKLSTALAKAWLSGAGNEFATRHMGGEEFRVICSSNV